jgi:predicted transcriptional regulator
MAKKTISFNIDEDDLLKLDEYATNLERDRTHVLNQAVKEYISRVESRASQIEAASEGPAISLEQMLEVLRKDRKAREGKRQRIAS